VDVVPEVVALLRREFDRGFLGQLVGRIGEIAEYCENDVVNPYRGT
jgi:hypothetical protein